MKINNIEEYFDGGSISIFTDCGEFCIDDRIDSTTRYQLYDGYPKDDDSNLIKNSNSIQLELLEAIKDYNIDKEWCEKVIIKILKENLKNAL